ncbi:MAG: hypothetical protein H7843_01895 [Nitrospirota bacterium]
MKEQLSNIGLAEKLSKLSEIRRELKVAPIEDGKDQANSLADRIDKSTFGDISGLIKELAGIESETERAIFVDLLSKKHNTGRRAIQKDIQKLRKDDNVQSQPVVYSMNFPGLVDVVTDCEGSISYLIKDGEHLYATNNHELDGTIYSPPNKENMPFLLARYEEVSECYKKEDGDLLNDLIAYFKRFSCLYEKQWLIVACKVFLTYLQDHPDIHYMAMLLFYAVPERGKSRTGKSIIYVSYRGVHLVDLREANIFRYSENLRATLFFDLMDLWKKAVKNGAEDILLLRYEKGAKATRVIYPEKGAFEDMKHYNVYGPTLLATNENIHKILDTRCLNISMPNKPGEYENPTPEKALSLKERLTAWRARVMDKPLPAVEHVAELSGRLWDIAKPLLQICKMVNPEGFDDLKEALIEIAGQRIEDKKGSLQGQIVSILEELSPVDVPEWTIKTAEVLDKINENRPEDKKLTGQYIGRRLRELGLKTKLIHGYSEIFLSKNDFDILLSQYNNIISDTSHESLPKSTKVKEPENTPVSTGRLSNDDKSKSTQCLPAKNRMDSTSRTLVDIGRLSDGTIEKNIPILESDGVEVEI